MVPLAALALAWGCGRRSAGGDEEIEVEPLVSVRVADVEAMEASSAIEGVGYVEPVPNHEARLSAPLTGRVTRLSVTEGGMVTQGQVVAELYNSDLAGSVQAAQGVLRQTRAGEERAAKDAALQAKEERTRVAQAEAAVRNAEAALQKLLNGPRAEEVSQARAAVAREEAKLAELRAGTRSEDVAAARRELDVERASLAALVNGARPEEIEEAEAELRAEQAELDRLRAGPRIQEVATAEAALRSAETALSTAQAASDRANKLYEKGIYSLAQAEAARADLASAQAARDAAAQQLSVLREGTRAEEIRAQEARVAAVQARYQMVRKGPRSEAIAEARAKVAAAEEAVRKAETGPRPQEIEQQAAEVARVRSELDLLTAAPRSEDVASARAAVTDARAELSAARAGHLKTEAAEADVRAAAGRSEEAGGRLAEASAVLANSVVRAPVSGQVSSVAVRVGETVTEGALIADIVNLSAVQVRLRVPIEALAGVRVGLEADVSVDALRGAVFHGLVNVVSPEVHAESGTAELLVYLDNPEGLLREGMFTRVSIRTPERETLSVPDAAILSEEAETFVYVVKDGVATIVPVSIGESVHGRTQVLDGLEAGQQVVIEGGYGLPDGAAVTVRP